MAITEISKTSWDAILRIHRNVSVGFVVMSVIATPAQADIKMIVVANPV